MDKDNMMKGKLKLYVWEGVLCDYTNGIAFALAPSIKEAKKQLIKKGINEYHFTKGYLLDGVKANVYSGRCAFYQFGGG